MENYKLIKKYRLQKRKVSIIYLFVIGIQYVPKVPYRHSPLVSQWKSIY